MLCEGLCINQRVMLLAWCEGELMEQGQGREMAGDIMAKWRENVPFLLCPTR